jgi:type I restriction enzyme, R subunit
LEKALAFDSDEINAIVKDLGLLKVLFKNKMEQKAPGFLKLVTHGFNDKDVDDLIEHFRDKERRKEFFKEFKELEMLYEIISPDAFLRPYIDEYTSLAAIYAVVAKAYTKQVYVDKAFQRKTNELVQKHVTSSPIAAVTDFVAIDAQTIDLIKEKHGGDDTKVINLIKSIEKTAEEEAGDPFLIAMAERAKVIQENYEDRQTSTAGAGRAVCSDQAKRAAQERAGQQGLRLAALLCLYFAPGCWRQRGRERQRESGEGIYGSPKLAGERGGTAVSAQGRDLRCVCG